MNMTLSTKASNTAPHANKSNDIARHAIALVRKADVDKSKLERQIRRGSIASIAGLIGTVGVFLFIVLGPTLQEPTLLFVVFLLITCLALFVMAVLTTAGPMMTAFAYHKIRLAQARGESLEVQEEFEQVRRKLEVAVGIFQKVQRSDKQEWQNIIENHKDDITAICAQ